MNVLGKTGNENFNSFRLVASTFKNIPLENKYFDSI